MLNKYHIYIPSKGRADKCLTANVLKFFKIDFTVVVEPQDYQAYLKAGYNVLELDANDMGLPYVRNYIKKHSKSIGEDYHRQLDDDIMIFRQRIDNKNIKKHPLDTIIPIEDYVSQFSNVALAGLRDSVYAWSQNCDISFNKQISSAILVNNNVDNNWNSNMIEDTDYSLSVLFKGYCTVIFNRLIYDKKPNKQFAGGLQNDKSLRYEQLQRNLVAKYPEHLKISEKDGVTKVAPSRVRSLFQQRPE